MMSTTTKGTYWHATANNFAKAGKVRGSPQPTLSATGAKAEPRHHLIKNEYRAVACAQLPHGLHKARFRQYAVHVAGNGLGNDTSNLIAQLSKGLLKCRRVIEGQGYGVLGQHVGHARRAGYTKGKCARPGFD